MCNFSLQGDWKTSGIKEDSVASSNVDPRKKKKKTGVKASEDENKRFDKTIAIPELQKDDGFVQETPKKKGSFEKTAVIPELSREAIAGEEKKDEPGFHTTAVGGYVLSKKAMLLMSLRKWWLVIVSVALVLGLILYKSI